MPKRIESKTSRTAEFTCMARYLSTYEKVGQLRSDDYISRIIVNSFINFIMRFHFASKLILKKFPYGMYGYVIARTKYIDEIVKSALMEGVEQILILGAGFDSRGIRFRDLSQKTKIFELDAFLTQNAKIERYKEKGIQIPENLIFIPIDFDRQSISDRLCECGFEKGKRCLFILEGLTMYLQSESVEDLFSVIRSFAGPGSRVAFDFIYSSVLRQENLYEGEKELFNSVSKSGEGFCFGIEKGTVNEYLSKYGFEATDISDSDVLQNRYFKGENGPIIPVNGTHCIVSAVKVASN